MHSTGINAFNLLWKDIIVTSLVIMRSSERLPTLSDKNPFDKLAIFPKKGKSGHKFSLTFTPLHKNCKNTHQMYRFNIYSNINALTKSKHTKRQYE